MYGIIYCITNAVNGKQYIGQTTGVLGRRWCQHTRRAKNGLQGLLSHAIRKYGEESFSVEQLDTGDSREELNKKEIVYIAQLSTLAPRGYNLTFGGEGAVPSEEVRKKISEKARCRDNSKYGKPASQETRKKLSQIALNRPPVSKETREKLSRSAQGRKLFCKRNHPFDKVNTYIKPCNGQQVCLTCWYLWHNKPLPERLQGYITGKEVLKYGKG